LSRVVKTIAELAVWVARSDIPVPREIDNPPAVVETLGGAKVRAGFRPPSRPLLTVEHRQFKIALVLRHVRVAK
jgi:hypothetical protein